MSSNKRQIQKETEREEKQTEEGVKEIPLKRWICNFSVKRPDLHDHLPKCNEISKRFIICKLCRGRTARACAKYTVVAGTLTDYVF